MPRQIYLDHSASTPCDNQVLTAMQPYFTQIFSNPSASHRQGRQAETAIEQARETVAKTLNCQTEEIIFTSGGSESNNLATRGLTQQQNKQNYLISTATEHDSIYKTIQQLSDVGHAQQSILPVDPYGVYNPNTLKHHLHTNIRLISLSYANNEVGSISDLPRATEIAKTHNTPFHSDAIQATGQLPVNVQDLGIDLMSLSAHKFYGPKGIGVLYVRKGTKIIPTQTGGSHEHNLRAGTQNTPLIVGLAKALEIAYDELDYHTQHYQALRDQLIDGILSNIPSSHLTGHPELRLPSHASFIFEGIDSNTLLMHLDIHGIAASSGSACKTGNPEPSRVLLAMGYSEQQAKSGLRLTVGRQNTTEEIDYTVKTLIEVIEKLRRLEKVHS